MDYGDGECDVSHAVSADGFLGNFYTAAITDDTFVSDAFIFTAGAFSVACWSEDFFAEESVSFGAEGSVVDSFGFSDFAFGTVKDVIG